MERMINIYFYGFEWNTQVCNMKIVIYGRYYDYEVC